MINIFEIKWPVSANVYTLTTTRIGGVSKGVYAGLNLAEHVNDIADDVAQNRQILMHELNLISNPKWLNQTHSTNIVIADQADSIVDADGSYTMQPGCICAVLTADCLPVFLADSAGRCVGVFHAGWRGLANGILVNAVQSMANHSDHLLAAIGPAISQLSFEVGAEVKEIFVQSNSNNKKFFVDSTNKGHFYADLYGLAKKQLLDLGVKSVWLNESVCTFKDSGRFYSYRRDGQTGRMASLIWFTQ